MTKAAQILEKMVSIPDTFSPKVTDLSLKAKNILGYGFLADRILPDISLTAILKKLDIQPFKQATVDAYKQTTLEEAKVGIAKSSSNRRRRSSTRERAAWRLVPISQYKKAIPQFVLAKAVQIKESHPDVELFVDELQKFKVTYYGEPKKRQSLDPFLVARKDKETYYIEVWDEKKFEHKLY